MADRTRNAIVFLVVTGAHVVAIVSIRWSPEIQRDAAETIYGMFVDIEPTRNPIPKAKTQLRAIHSEPESIGTAEVAPIELIKDTSSVAPAINWQEEGSLSAGSVVNRKLQEEGLRLLHSQPKTLTPVPEKVAPGIFTLTPPHKPGTFENLGEGITREWVSDYCYYWNDMGPEGRVPRKKCLPKFANPNSGNLFKQFRPKYLDTPQSRESHNDSGHANEQGEAER